MLKAKNFKYSYKRKNELTMYVSQLHFISQLQKCISCICSVCRGGMDVSEDIVFEHSMDDIQYPGLPDSVRCSHI